MNRSDSLNSSIEVGLPHRSAVTTVNLFYPCNDSDPEDIASDMFCS